MAKPQEIMPTLEEQLEARDKKRAADCLKDVLKLCAERECQLEAVPRILQQGQRLVVDAVAQIRAMPLKPKAKKAEETKK